MSRRLVLDLNETLKRRGYKTPTGLLKININTLKFHPRWDHVVHIIKAFRNKRLRFRVRPIKGKGAINVRASQIEPWGIHNERPKKFVRSVN